MRTRMLATFAAGLVLSGVAAASGSPGPGVLQGSEGVAAGALRYVALPAGQNTMLEAIRVRGGRVVRYGLVPGRWGVPLVTLNGTAGGLSHTGRTLVLGALPSGSGSSFAFVDTRRVRLVRTVRLKGQFSYDALSPDEGMLYLIEHLSTNDATKYQVRAYDLELGRLVQQVVAAKGETDMRGYPLARAGSRDGVWAYTLYGGTPRHSFVHALDTTQGQAVCIDLPWRGTTSNLSKLRLTVEGGRLLLRRPGQRPAAVVNTSTFQVLSSVQNP